jgi:uncharacterized protein with PQ loop repeat
MIVQPTLVENVLIVIGEGSWVLAASAQLRRLAKTRNVRGLSAPSQTLNAAGNMGWCTYFALNHLWFPFVTNVVVLLLAVGILGFILSNRRQFVRGLITIAIVGPLTAYVLFSFPAQAGWLGMSYNWLAATPELLLVVRRKKVSGISEKGLYFSTGAMIFTLAYATLIHSLPLMTGCIQGLIYMSVIMTCYYRHRKHG